jgi:carboxymethylenebutenolidase
MPRSVLERFHPARHPRRRDHRGTRRPARHGRAVALPAVRRFGEEDQNPPVALEAELKKRAQAAGKDVTTKIYKNAGHAFLADYRPSYREEAAKELWNDAQSFFGKHLK